MFNDRIKQLREGRQMLQRQFASALEIDTPMYSKIERGEQDNKVSCDYGFDDQYQFYVVINF